MEEAIKKDIFNVQVVMELVVFGLVILKHINFVLIKVKNCENLSKGEQLIEYCFG